MPRRDAETIGTAEAHRITGFSQRWLTTAAAAGTIPGARQPSGEGGAWRFDRAAFDRWWDGTRKGSGGWRPSTGAAKRGGDVSNVKAVTSGSPLRRRLKEWRANA